MNYYVDLFFLLNLVVDFILLSLTAKVGHIRTSKRRLWLASIIGSGYVVATFYVIDTEWLISFTSKFLVAILMVWVVTGFQKLYVFIRALLIFYAVSSMIAGFMFVVYFNNQRTEGSIEPWLLLCSFVGGLVFMLVIERTMRVRAQLQSVLAIIEIEIDEFSISFRGLIDTGNQLRDPLTGAPVTITELVDWRTALPDSLFAQLQDTQQLTSYMHSQSLGQPFRWLHRMVWVPYHGIGPQGQQMMMALRVDRAKVTWEKREYRTDRALIGIIGNSLHQQQSYRAIIHPDFLRDAS